jgi:hypothetical protein
MGDNRLPSAKEVLHGAAPMPEGVSPEDLPAGMAGDRGDPLTRGWHGDGWVRVTPMDRPGRRALWYRTPRTIAEAAATDDDALMKAMHVAEHPLEMRAGREGDDTHVLLDVGTVLTAQTISEIADALERGRAYVEDP